MRWNDITKQIIGAAIDVHLLVNFNVSVLKDGIRRRIL
jgi:hypothetical protein